MKHFERIVERCYSCYEDLSLQEKIDVIAGTFGYNTGTITTSPCSGKWRGTSDVSILFDSGIKLFLGNALTPKSKTKRLQTKMVDASLMWYNPKITEITKQLAYHSLLFQERADNACSMALGLKPYRLLSVELSTGANGYIGWYYVVIEVEGEILAHIETGLNYAIRDAKTDAPNYRNYFIAGGLNEADFVYNSCGFSTKIKAPYCLPIGPEVLERAENCLRKRIAAESQEKHSWGFYIIPDIKTWAVSSVSQSRSPLEHYKTFEEAKARFIELRKQPCNLAENDVDSHGVPYAHLTLGIENTNGMSSIDILHVRGNKNFLVSDFSIIDQLRDDLDVMEILSKVDHEIGFDMVRPYDLIDDTHKPGIGIPFSAWDNPYFDSDGHCEPYSVTGAGQKEAAVVCLTENQLEAVGYHRAGMAAHGRYLIMSNGENAFAVSTYHPGKRWLDIYQLKDQDNLNRVRFLSYEKFINSGEKVVYDNYASAYSGELEKTFTLEEIFYIFNMEIPDGFHGHSLSVSDVIVLEEDMKKTAWFVDSIGFREIPDFFGPEE